MKHLFRQLISLLLVFSILTGCLASFAEGISAESPSDVLQRLADEMSEASADAAEQSPSLPAELGPQSRSVAFVGSSEELIAAVEADPFATIYLTQDFAMNGNCSTVYFSGVLDGQNHTISGLNITSGSDGTCGLFAGLYGGTIQNLNVTGANLAVSAGSGWTRAGILCGVVDNESKISNCSVSGTVTVTGGQAGSTVFVGGLTGCVLSGSIASSQSNVNITVSVPCSSYVGGLAGVVNSGIMYDSDYSGNLLLTQSAAGSGSVYQAYGNSYSHDKPSRNCNVSGSVRVETIDGSGIATGVATASNSTNSASVSAVTSGGTVTAQGCSEGRYLTNNGSVTASLLNGAGTAYALGVTQVKYGGNTASVTARASGGSVYACGAENVDSHVDNSGSVSAVSDSGSATAVGINGMDNVNNSFFCTNTGNVNAETRDGSAFACGVSHCMRSTNRGEVSVSTETGSAAAQGMTYTHHGSNEASVTGIFTGEEHGITLSVQGLNSCTGSTNRGHITGSAPNSSTNVTVSGAVDGSYCINYGRIEATTNTGNAVANGVKCSYSQNHGYILAKCTGAVSRDSDNASAYGIGGGYTRSYNTGDVAAVSVDGGAHAYGYGSGCSKCVSTGNASAISQLFEQEITDTSVSILSGRAFARNSASAQIAVGPGSTSAAGGEQYSLYYHVPSSYCSSHKGMSMSFVSYRPGAYPDCECTYMDCGIAASVSETEYEEPDMPIVPEEPDDLLDDALLIDLSMTVSSRLTAEPVPFKSFEYACGSMVCSSTELGVDYGSPFNLRIGMWANLTGPRQLKLALPAGFSFDPWEIVTEKTFSVDLVSDIEAEENITVYPIYMESFSDLVTFTVYDLTNGSGASVASEECAVYRVENEGVIYCRPSGGINGQPYSPIEIYACDSPNTVNTGLNIDFADCFVGASGSYNHKLAVLGCALSQSVYGSNHGDQTLYLDASFKNLGFSELKWYTPQNVVESAMEVGVYLAQKKVARNGEVRNVLMTVVRGTYDLDWIGNFFAYDDDELDTGDEIEGHYNFLHAAQVAKNDITDYVADHMSIEEYERTTAYLCGHSRGGAVTDLLCYLMETTSWGDFCSAKTAYTFAAPNSLKDSYSDSDVHNILFINDLVGYVPGEMYKYGTTYVIGTRDNNAVLTRVRQLHELFDRDSDVYEVPNNDMMIIGALVFGNLVRTQDKVLTAYNSMSEEQKALWQAGFDYLTGGQSDKIDLVADAGLGCQYLVSILTGMIVGVGPKLQYEFLNNLLLTGPVAEAHGAENYLAWMLGNGISGAIDYESARQLYRDINWPELLLEAVRNAADATGEFVLDCVKTNVDALTHLATMAKDYAMSRVDEAAAALDAAQQALQNAADAAAQTAAQAAYDAAEAAYNLALDALEQKRYAAEQLPRMPQDFSDSVFGWASGLIWSNVSETFAGNTLLAISCPVDVQVTDTSGGVIANFDNHTLTAGSNAYLAESTGETDFILIDGHAPATLNVTGNGDGHMNIVAFKLDESGSVRACFFYPGVPVAPGETFTLDMTDGNAGSGRSLVSGSGTEYECLSVDGLTLIDVSADAVLAESGDTVTFTIRSIGGSGTVTYHSSLYKDGELYAPLGAGTSLTVPYTFMEPGSYTLEVAATDESGASAGPVMSGTVIVSPGTLDDRWTYGGEIFESVVWGDNVWIGNLYGVHYDGTWLNSWEDYDVTVEASHENAVISVLYSEGWTDGVNFNLSGITESTDLVITVTVHKKDGGDENYDDLRFSRVVQVLAGDDIVPLTIAPIDDTPIILHVGESITIDKPAFVENDPTFCWWVQFELTNWDPVSMRDNGSGQLVIQANAPGVTTAGFSACCGSYRGSIQKSLQIISLGEGQSIADAFATSVTAAASRKESAGGAVTWSVANPPVNYPLSYRFDLYRNGVLCSEGPWQTELTRSFELNDAGVYEVLLVLADGTGSTAECASSEDGKTLLHAGQALKLPASLKQIDSEAFLGTTAEEIVLPDGAESIGSRAFADSDVKIIRIPATVQNLWDDCIEGTENVAFVCQSDGWIRWYAAERGIPYIIID